jgi:hypothetical protein
VEKYHADRHGLDGFSRILLKKKSMDKAMEYKTSTYLTQHKHDVEALWSAYNRKKPFQNGGRLCDAQNYEVSLLIHVVADSRSQKTSSP